MRLDRLAWAGLIYALTSRAQNLGISQNLPANWTSQGCVTDSTANRALTGASFANSSTTQELCINFCINNKYNYALVEYGDECYCGNSVLGGSSSAPNSDCNMACAGNSREACGAGNHGNLFWDGQTPAAGPTTNPGPPGWGSLGCYTDSVNSRTLPNGLDVPGGSNNMSVAGCTGACQRAGFKYSAVEYAAECYCGSSIGSGASSATSGCDMPCKGNSSEFCGGSNRINLYQFGSVASTTSQTSQTSSDNGNTKTSSSISTISSSTTSASTSSSVATGLPTGWSYKGCWIDGANGRILQNAQPGNSNLTIQSCAQACSQAGYKIAGAEYSTECYCGNQVIAGGTQASNDADCNMACGGDASEKCGGPNRMSLYSASNITVLQPPKTTNSTGNWTYSGCYTDGPDGNGERAFAIQLILKDTNAPETCLMQCSHYGYMTGAMEYGDECYCGDFDTLEAHNETIRPDSQCNMACSGNGTEICGGQNRLSVYTWTGTPLYIWSYPQGNAAGSYTYFVPGVVVPLITVPGKNGKITFVEKHGTSFYGNSTGAYELDPSLAGDFSKAWREMDGIMTDVFCSAGLILPDKGARQINVGGWSDISTYGVRFYTPDGQLGTNSTNNWEEDPSKIRLQAGRWYPSAMIMANGSILVVGGEDGSNGNPTPSLELLPQVGGTIFCDWLQRTDPNNLYPFLAVLPSGGIFVAYYNEARILDPATFATIKTLPNMPGTVDRTTGGRTYPLEGTAMLLPQHAPYSDPIRVLLCGGSPGVASTAIDNCISIEPDNPASNWTLERMPSPRVMTCIAALPDGTFLILNGAETGVAGFGLASNPNLNAILYDPSKPFGARMSVMANTTIARLYHSEAVVMDDGRVLVSGSDPQDNVHPEEMRVEVFTPPYLLSGAARPSFALPITDWSYGSTYTFTLTSATSANVRVSLLGAVASTHGNSMGQRTIFPAATCQGGSCSVTAPPNANVCPPGWFQMFVLDGPTPSHAVWVRIGGDPGSLGEWPSAEGFTRPGS